MEEKLIDFETAKLAKEKGFDELIIHYYKSTNENNVFTHRRRGGYHKGKTYELRNSNMVIGKKGIIKYSAPTQSLLQKWLREKHNIHIKIEVTTQCNFYYSIVQFLEPPKNKANPAKIGYQNVANVQKVSTYEKALEAGLQEALNLI